MKYSVIKCVNGNFSVSSEHSDIASAKVAYHNQCAALWNAADVITGSVSIVDENLITYSGYVEAIAHEPEESNGD